MVQAMSRVEPLVSILISVYNGQKYLAECIDSVLSQTYQNWEYLIVNNRSTDGTLDLAQPYALRDPRVRVHTNEEFVNRGENHNIAFRRISPRANIGRWYMQTTGCFPTASPRW